MFNGRYPVFDTGRRGSGLGFRHATRLAGRGSTGESLKFDENCAGYKLIPPCGRSSRPDGGLVPAVLAAARRGQLTKTRRHGL